MMAQSLYTYSLFQDDCFSVLPTLDAHSVDLIVTDPPYGITANNPWDKQLDIEQFFSEAVRVAKDNAAIILFSSGMFTANLMKSSPKGLWRYNLIWQKTTPVGYLNAKRMPLRGHEDICVFYKKLPVYNPQITHGHARKVSSAASQSKCKMSTNYGNHPKYPDYDSTDRYPTSVLTFATDKQKPDGRLHPTQKPVALCEWLVRSYSNPGDVVLDPFMGSGTTGIASLNNQRSFIGIELDKNYFNSAYQRIELLHGNPSSTT